MTNFCIYQVCVWTRTSAHDQCCTTVVDVGWFIFARLRVIIDNHAFKILKNLKHSKKLTILLKVIQKEQFDFLPRYLDWVYLKIVHLRLNPKILIRSCDLNHFASMFIKTYVMVIWSDKYGSWVTFVSCHIIIWTWNWRLRCIWWNLENIIHCIKIIFVCILEWILL